MFWSKNTKNRYTPAYPSFAIIKVGYKGVYITRTCYSSQLAPVPRRSIIYVALLFLKRFKTWVMFFFPPQFEAALALAVGHVNQTNGI